MSHSKNGLRALGVCLLAALGLVAFAAASAQAQTGWLLDGKFITATSKVDASIHPLKAEDKELHLVLLTKIGAKEETKVEILCEKLVVDDGLLFASEKAEGLAILLFTICKTLLNGVVSAPCKPAEPIESHVLFRAILHTVSPTGGTHDNKTYLLFEPGVLGNPFVTLKFSEECAIGEKVPITGDLVAECLNTKLEKNLSTTDYCLEDLEHHLIQEAPHKLFLLTGSKEKFDELQFQSHLASLLGIVDILDEVKGHTFAVHI